MSFSAEINDFVAGFKATSDIMGAAQDRKMKKEQIKYEREKDASDREWDREKFNYGVEADFHKRALEEKKYASDVDKAEADEKYRSASLAEQRADRESAEGRAKTQAELERERLAASTNYQTGLLDEQKKRRESEDSRVKTQAELKREELELRRKYGWGRGSTSAESNYLDGAEYDPEGEAAPEDDVGPLLDAAGAGYEDGVEEPAYAQGGVVEPTEEPAEEAIPTAPPKAAAPKEPTVNREGKGDASVLFASVKPIVRDVFETANAEGAEKPTAIDVGGKSQDRLGLFTGKNAATNEEIKAIDAKIDPKGEMDPQQKTAARLVHAYNFYVEKGEPTKARKIAVAIIDHNKQSSQILGKLAQSAVERGDLSSASKFISDAYNLVPDGKSTEGQVTEKGTLLFKVNHDNRVLMSGEATPQQLWQLAGGVANGSEFLRKMEEVAEGGEGDAVPAEGGAKKSKNYVRYDDVLTEAAGATRSLRNLEQQHNALLRNKDQDGVEEQIVNLEYQMAEAQKAAAAAQKKLSVIGARTRRPPSKIASDLAAATRNSVGAIPTDAPAPVAKDNYDPTAPMPGSLTGTGQSAWEVGPWARHSPSFVGGVPALAAGGQNTLTPSPGQAAASQQAIPTAPVTPASNPPSGPVQIKSKAQYDALPPGTSYVAPDGSLRRKPNV